MAELKITAKVTKTFWWYVVQSCLFIRSKKLCGLFMKKCIMKLKIGNHVDKIFLFEALETK